jgi:hypothetical protein
MMTRIQVMRTRNRRITAVRPKSPSLARNLEHNEAQHTETPHGRHINKQFTEKRVGGWKTMSGGSATGTCLIWNQGCAD